MRCVAVAPAARRVQPAARTRARGPAGRGRVRGDVMVVVVARSGRGGAGVALGRGGGRCVVGIEEND